MSGESICSRLKLSPGVLQDSDPPQGVAKVLGLFFSRGTLGDVSFFRFGSAHRFLQRRSCWNTNVPEPQSHVRPSGSCIRIPHPAVQRAADAMVRPFLPHNLIAAKTSLVCTLHQESAGDRALLSSPQLDSEKTNAKREWRKEHGKSDV
jgi:hypothetical protein